MEEYHQLTIETKSMTSLPPMGMIGYSMAGVGLFEPIELDTMYLWLCSINKELEKVQWDEIYRRAKELNSTGIVVYTIPCDILGFRRVIEIHGNEIAANRAIG